MEREEGIRPSKADWQYFVCVWLVHVTVFQCMRLVHVGLHFVCLIILVPVDVFHVTVWKQQAEWQSPFMQNDILSKTEKDKKKKNFKG